ncbi:DUF6639 family protein [Marimonas lutisalis]|uniref:DUF6639 family protein n=1 Tax=Marimonas lutisalis TaxID=2545756 RepID=UPI0010F5264F|nr:DUF6639 family protein [Marimonas lutisalis]
MVAASAADASQHTACDTRNVTVIANDPEVSSRVCTVADRALARLEKCNLRQTQPITIEIKAQLEYGHPACLGAFVCAENRVELLPPSQISDQMDDTHAFAGLSATDLFDSLIVHELTHALVFQTAGDEMPTVSANEYIAYALQLDSLSAPNRRLVLQSHPTGTPVMADDLNDMVLMFSPGLFAARAWLHFSAPGHGCDFVKRLLENETRLNPGGY